MTMKKILVAACLLLTVAAQAQMKEGRIVYERTMQMRGRMFASNGNQEMPVEMPKSRTDTYELLFGNNQSVYQFLPSATGDDQTMSVGGGTGFFQLAGSNDIVYFNFDNRTRIEMRDFMQNEFLVTDTIAKNNWKLTDETKKILNFTARKAVAQSIRPAFRTEMENGQIKRTEYKDTVPVVAWFTTEIPVSVAPGTDMAGQLPGAILELDVANGRNVYKAVEVSPKVSVAKIKAPSKGKKVTQAEFAAERERVTSEMMKNMPAGNTIRIQQ
jgi:GLPGLI family protein